MTWKELWISLWGTTEWLGIDMGFGMAMAIVMLIVIAMNVVFWRMKPQKAKSNGQQET